MEAALLVSEPAVSDDRADDPDRSVLHLLHGDGEGADLVIAVEVERIAGEVAGGNGVGAFGDEGDCSVMRRRSEKRGCRRRERREWSASHKVRSVTVVSARRSASSSASVWSSATEPDRRRSRRVIFRVAGPGFAACRRPAAPVEVFDSSSRSTFSSRGFKEAMPASRVVRRAASGPRSK